MGQEQVIREILEKMREKRIALDNLSFDGNYKIEINDLAIELTFNKKGTLIFYNGDCKRIEFIEELAQEVVTLLSEEEWEAGQLVIKNGVKRIVVTQQGNEFNLLDDLTYDLEYAYPYATTEELKTIGWKKYDK